MTQTARNTSTRYEDHTGLLHKLAVKFYARLLAARVISIEFEDVLAELDIPFVHAQRAYKIEKGYAFTAYLGRACENHFNKFAEKLLCEQYGDGAAERGRTEHAMQGSGGLGYVSLSSLQGGEGDFDYLDSVEQDTFAVPEDLVDAKMTLATIEGDDTLLEETRAFIAHVASPGFKLTADMRRRIGKNSRKVRDQLADRYGVELASLVL